MYDVAEERDEETIKHARDRTWLYSQAIAIFHVVQNLRMNKHKRIRS